MDINLNDNNFKEEISNYDGIILVDFWAPWCGPCKMMSPIIEELAQEFDGKLKIRKINVNENPSTASQYEILSIPALKFFKDGEIIDEVVGLRDKSFLVEKINSLINQ